LDVFRNLAGIDMPCLGHVTARARSFETKVSQDDVEVLDLAKVRDHLSETA
jgi:hypothetical protein